MGTAADVSSIITSVIAVGGLLLALHAIFWKVRQHRKALEEYLKSERDRSADKGQRTMLHLMRHLKMTEDEIFHAACKSDRVELAIRAGEESGLAENLLFHFVDRT